MIFFFTCFIFWLFPLFAGILSGPISATVFKESGLNSAPKLTRDLSLGSIRLALGVVLFLLLFSLVAKVLPNYSVAVSLVFILLGCASLAVYWLEKHPPSNPKSLRGFGASIWRQVKQITLSWIFLVIINVIFWIPRRAFPDIQFDPARLGAEKLFNLHFMQAFVHGSGFPPENLWLAGESITYYILPKTLGGLTGYFMNLAFDAPLQMGILFHLSDTFFLALGFCTSFAVVRTLVLAFGGISSRAATSWALGAALLPWLAAPARAYLQLFESRPNLWALSRIIGDTINEYPFWNYVWADNHAHSAIIFAQVLLLFLIILAVRSVFVEISKNARIVLAFLIALTSATIAQSHAMSVFIAVGFYGIFFALFILFNKKPAWDRLAKYLPLIVIPAFVVTIPHLMSMPQPGLRWYLVPAALASPLVDYLNVHFSEFLLFFILLLILAIYSKVALKQATTSQKALSLTEILLGILLSFLGWSTAGFFLVLCGITSIILTNSKEKSCHHSIKIALLHAVFSLLILTELLAFNFDMGDKYMRYNTLFRYLFESFHLLPIVIGVIFATCTQWQAVPRWLGHLGIALLLIAAVMAIRVQFFTYSMRSHERAANPTLNGMEFMADERPGDWSIIQFLAHETQHVVLAEECGMPPKPTAYGIPGRISAYSGRLSLCGWGGHTQQFHLTMTGSSSQRGTSTWQNLFERDAAIRELFTAFSSDTAQPVNLEKSLAQLRQLGVTHLVYGQWEQELHPTFSLERAATKLGQIVFRQGALGVIRLGS